ncbi:MarR family winged helix-turn-helix transcriptional regulator [Salana multivorans]
MTAVSSDTSDGIETCAPPTFTASHENSARLRSARPRTRATTASTREKLAVLEDIARHPHSAINEVTRRTGLAQSLVSRITRAMADAGAVIIEPDPSDRRKVRVSLDEATRAAALDRADNPATEAIAAAVPTLTDEQRASLEHHLAEAANLLYLAAEEEQSDD